MMLKSVKRSNELLMDVVFVASGQQEAVTNAVKILNLVANSFSWVFRQMRNTHLIWI